MKRLDPRLINAILLGVLALGLTLALRALESWNAVSLGSLFLFVSAAAIGLPGAIISATIALAPTVVIAGDIAEAARLFLTCLAVGFIAERSPRLPPFLVVIGCWTVTWLGLVALPHGLAGDLPRWGLAAVLEIVFAAVAGALLLNPSIWALIAQRPRFPSVASLHIHVMTLVSFVAMWSGRAVFSAHTELPTTALNSLLWGGKLVAIGLLIPALIGYRLANILVRDFQEWFRLGHVPLKESFSGLSSGYWRRSEADDFIPATSSADNIRPSDRGNSDQVPTVAASITPAHGICALNRDGTITFINRRFAKLCGMRTTEVVGKKIDAVGIPPELCAHIFRLTEETLARGARIAEIKLNRLPEPLRFFEVAVTAANEVEDSAMSGGPESVIVSLKDITDRRTVEDHLLQAQRLGSLGELVGGVAHAFNNSLTTIVGHASFARMTGQPEAIQAALQEIIAASSRASDLVTKLRALSSDVPSMLDDHDLGTVIADRVGLLRSLVGENYDLIFEQPDQSIVSMCDPSLLAQAFTNLVLNARDSYNGKSGTIEIALSTETLDDDVCDLFVGARPGNFARMSIKDTGFGMSPETLARAFDPLFTTKRSQGNSGLGLSIVYSIVRAHDGFLAAESHPEKGTTITMYLPLRSVAPAHPNTAVRESAHGATPLATIAGNRERILVVEDERQVRELVVAMLVRLGYEVASCANGHEALERCRDAEFDLIVLDMIMPRMNGLDVVSHLKASGKSPRTLLMTGYGLEQPGKESVGGPVLAKPFDLITLGTRVKETLNSASAATGAAGNAVAPS